MPVLWLVRTVNAEAVQLPRSNVWKQNMPDMVGSLRHADPDRFMVRIRMLKQAKINAGRVFRIESKVNPFAGQSCTQGVRSTGPYSHLVHTELNPYLVSLSCRPRTTAISLSADFSPFLRYRKSASARLERQNLLQM